MPIGERITDFANRLFTILTDFSIFDLLDILLVAFIIFSIIKLIRETRAFQLAKGFILLGIVYALSTAFRMEASTFIFNRLFSDMIIFIIILFQPEIKHALESFGGRKLKGFDFFGLAGSEKAQQDELVRKAIIDVCKECGEFSNNKTGAIIVFERETPLGNIINTGTVLDSAVSRALLGNIFFPMSPLHDGALVIRGGRIAAAGCILPLTQNASLSRELGTRHRAALGLSEECDAVTVVVSEETGIISVAVKGRLDRNLTEAVLRERLLSELITEKTEVNGKSIIKKIFGGKNK